MPFLAFLTGPLGKLAGYAALAVALALGCVYLVHTHDVKVLAVQAAKEAAAVQAERDRENAAAIAALKDQHAAEIARLTASTAVKQVIAHAPVTTACFGSPAIAISVAELRRRAGPGVGAAVNPGGTASVQPPAKHPQPAR